MRCKECYSDNPRITPLLGAEECLSRHMQYVCSTCGRYIYIGIKGAKKQDACFGSFESAILYLKTSEIMYEDVCGIYELIYKRGEKRYRVFKSVDELKEQLKKNKNIRCEKFEPVYISKKYIPVPDEQIIHLNKDEVRRYLDGRNKMGTKLNKQVK